MARTTIKATYSLPPKTVGTLERIARRWGVSKSEALARAIHAAAEQAAPPADVVTTLEELQRSLSLTPARAAAWVREARSERRAGRSSEKSSR